MVLITFHKSPIRVNRYFVYIASQWMGDICEK